MDWESFYRNYRKPDYIPGYEIVNKLGGGVFGVVFKARKHSIGKFYAIKFLKVEDDKIKEAVLRELEAVRFFAQIDHPNLVSIEDRGEVDGIPFIVMGYAGDETLKTRLEKGPLPPAETTGLFRQVCQGVQALHDKSIVHFDLKPGNIFLKNGIARVGDYGLSRLMSESRNTLSFGRGTPYYMAPEMLRKKGDRRSDVYSLGVILYECVAGEVPFQGASEWEVLKKHETEEVRFPRGFDRRFVDVVRRCLAKRPQDRLSSLRGVIAMLPGGAGDRSTAAADGETAAGESGGGKDGRGRAARGSDRGGGYKGRAPCGAPPRDWGTPRGAPCGWWPGRILGPIFGLVGLVLERVGHGLRQADDYVETIGKPGGPHPVPPRARLPAAEVFRRFESAGIVSALFRILGMSLETAMLAAIVPLKLLFAVVGRLLDSLVRLPFRLLSVAVKLVVVVVGFFFLFFFLRMSFYFLFRML